MSSDTQNLCLVHPDEEGAITIHLPMTIERVGRVMTCLAELGFDFDRDDLTLRQVEAPEEATPA